MNTETTSPELRQSMEKKTTSYQPLMIASSIVVALWLANMLCLAWVDSRGTFGDMFGTINALFSGLAFSGIIFTIILQKNELALQREELESTREVMKSQQKEFQIQNEWNKKQVFESSFYSLLRTHQEYLASCYVRGSVGRHAFDILIADFKNIHNAILQKLSQVAMTTRSRELFDQEYTLIYSYISNVNFGEYSEQSKKTIDSEIARIGRTQALDAKISEMKEIKNCIESAYANAPEEIKREICLLEWEALNPANKLATINDAYNELYRLNGLVTGPYFRLLFNIIKFIDESKMENKYFYGKLLRAHFSRPEIALLFYNNLSNKGSLQFIRYIDSYELLEGIYPQEVIYFKDIDLLWQQRAKTNY